MDSIPRRRHKRAAWYTSLMALLFLAVFIFVITQFVFQVKHATQEELKKDISDSSSVI